MARATRIPGLTSVSESIGAAIAILMDAVLTVRGARSSSVNAPWTTDRGFDFTAPAGYLPELRHLPVLRLAFL